MSLVETVSTIFDRLLAPRVAATASLASLLLLLATAGMIFLQVRTHVDISHEVQLETIIKAINSNANPTFITAAAIFFIIFVTGLCSLTIELLIAFVRLLKGALGRLLERLNRDLRKYERKERMQQTATKEASDFKEFLKYFRAIYPYFLISFDLIFYICVGILALIIIVVILVVPFLAVPFAVIGMGSLILGVIGALLEAIFRLNPLSSKKRKAKR